MQVSNCRPSKVREFLRTEATRIMREEASATFGRDEVAELISYKAGIYIIDCNSLIKLQFFMQLLYSEHEIKQ